MKKSLFGAVMCLAALLLLGSNQVLLGLPLFIAGIVLMFSGRWPRR
ncbi:MAG: hypothetical protein V2I32_08430 [Desulforhopalus sp.]|jgi:hypothetical protein|nr:hypothetical protein [Desulforhopalus sp.]HSL41651.1 hypothetical protein [Desulforhopalus sp.]